MHDPRSARFLGVLLAVVALTALCHIAIGSAANFSPLGTIHQILIGPGHDDPINSIVWDTRLPRVVACLLTGGILGVVGCAFQALFRNPLAEPHIVGASSGAAIGGAIAYVLGFGTFLGGLGMAVSGLVTGLLALGLVWRLARRRGVVEVNTLLLAGAVVGSLLSALLSLVLLAAGQDSNRVLRWLLGDMGVLDWRPDAVLAGALVMGTIILMRSSRHLNALALGTNTARQLGIDVRVLSRTILVTGGAMVAASVSAVGMIGFVGLVAPHIARRMVGVDWRRSIPASLLLGAWLVVMSDLFAQRGLGFIFPSSPIPFPVGIVTSLVGAPFLLILLRKETR